MPFSVYAIGVAILVIYILSVINIIPEYERAVILRLGRLLKEVKGPGLILVFRPIDSIFRISLRTVTMEVPPQETITRDNVTVKVNAVVFFRVMDPNQALVQSENYLYQTGQLAQTTLRSVIGEVELDDLLSQREKLNERLQTILDQHTAAWGVKVSKVEVKQVELPAEMVRAISKQAEAERERRAKIIHADGELAASQKLGEAAAILAAQPVSIQLRYLQTLTEIGVEKNTTIVFPLPVDIFSRIGSVLPGGANSGDAKPSSSGSGAVG